MKKIRANTKADTRVISTAALCTVPFLSKNFRDYVKTTSLIDEKSASGLYAMGVESVLQDAPLVYGFGSKKAKLSPEKRQQLARSMSVRFGPLISPEVAHVTLSGMSNQLNDVILDLHMLLTKTLGIQYVMTKITTALHVVLTTYLKSWYAGADTTLFYKNLHLHIAGTNNLADTLCKCVESLDNTTDTVRFDIMLDIVAKNILSQVVPDVLVPSGDCFELHLSNK